MSMSESGNIDHFVALTECHLLNPAALAETIGYYPDAERWWKSVRGVLRAWSGPNPKLGEPPIAETLIKHMDEAHKDMDDSAPTPAPSAGNGSETETPAAIETVPQAVTPAASATTAPR